MSSVPAKWPPIGLRLNQTARAVTAGFDQAMTEAGGSLPTWQVLLLVSSQDWETQSRIAKAMGITGATLSHHLNALESEGLVRRWRDQENRRVQRVELTAEGTELFERMRGAAMAYDKRLRSLIGEEGAEQLAELLDRLAHGLTQVESQSFPPTAAAEQQTKGAQT